MIFSIFSPDHLVYDTDIGLYDPYDLAGDVVGVVGHWNAAVSVGGHPDSELHGLQQPFGVNAAEDEAALVEGLGPLGAGPDADGGDGPADGGVERALLGERAAVADSAEGVHLEAVVVVESQGLLHPDPRVQSEPAGLEPVAGPGMAAVQHRHVVFLRHGVDGIEEGEEVALGVDVLLPVGREKDVPALLQPQPLMDIRGLYLRQVLPQHLGHRGAGDVGALPRQAALREVPPRVLAVGQVHVGDDVHYPAVGLLGKALVLAPVAGLHVEDGDVQPLRADDAQAGVGVPEDQHGVGLSGCHELVTGVDDVAAGGPQVVPDGVHVDVGVLQLQVAEEDAVEVVVVVLSGVGQQRVEVPAGLVDDGRQADDLRPGAHDDQQSDPAVILEVYVGIICLEFHVLLLFIYWVKVCVGASRVEDLVAVHHGDEVLRLREVDDVVGVAGEHYDALYPVTADLVIDYLVRTFFTHLYEAVAGDDDELLPLGVVPVLPLGDARPGDVDGYLAAAEGLHEFGEAAAPVGVHLQVEDRLLLGQVAQVGAQQPFGKTVGRHLRNHEGTRHVCESVEQIHYLA